MGPENYRTALAGTVGAIREAVYWRTTTAGERKLKSEILANIQCSQHRRTLWQAQAASGLDIVR